MHLRAHLVKTVVSSKEMDQRHWSSVYWPRGKYRPDKLSETINSMYDLADESIRSIMNRYLANEDDAALSRLESPSTSFNFHSGFTLDETSNVPEDKDEMIGILREGRARVEWNGARFEPKSVEFLVVNMTELRSARHFQKIGTFITYTPVSLTMNVAIDDDSDRPQNQLDPLNTKVEAIESQLRNISSLLSVVMRRQCPQDIGDGTVCFDRTTMSLSCYCFVKVLRNWNESDLFCRSKRMRLVSVESEGENDMLRTLSDNMQTALPKNMPHYWSSGSFDSTRGRWFWSTSNRSMSYSNWAKGRPRARAESLLLYFDDTYDQPRTCTRYSICEN